MARNAFDLKFGSSFAPALPGSPGVYLVYDTSEKIIYVGKAKNLRRRLQQYRNAKRRKKHRKMSEIVKRAARIETRVCSTELEASLLEIRLIQENRPAMNVAGAFHFLYPLIGLKQDCGTLHLCYTNHPEQYEGFSFYGSYRSRHFTAEAFFALIKLLKWIGHPIKAPARSKEKRGYVFSFRRLPSSWDSHWDRFFKGESQEILEELILALVENAGARKRASTTQEHLDALARFFRHEAVPLAKACSACGFTTYPVPQRERDLLFLQYRHYREEPAACER